MGVKTLSSTEEALFKTGREVGLSDEQIWTIIENKEKGLYLHLDIGEFLDEEPTKARFAKAGDADDCGHELADRPKAGKFAPGNTCAAGGGGEEESLPEKVKKPKKEKVYKNYYETRNENKFSLEKIHGSRKFSRHLDNWNTPETTALHKYSADSYESMNLYLRHGEVPSYVDKERALGYIDNLGNGLSKVALPENMILYRGVSDLRSLDKRFNVSNPDSMIGIRINDKGFLSTSMSMDTARSFSSSDIGAIFEIKADKGSVGVTTNGLAQIKSELEFVFDRDHVLEITGYRREQIGYSDERYLILEAKLIGKKAKGTKRLTTEKEKEAKAEVVKEEKAAQRRRDYGFPTDLGELTTWKHLGGSTGATLVGDKHGRYFVKKMGKDSDHITSEGVADGIYRALGVKVPGYSMYDTPQGKVKLSNHVDGLKLEEVEEKYPGMYKHLKRQIQEDFVADAFLGNWDVIGLDADNIIVSEKDGSIWRVDNGGSLQYRAQGEKKGEGKFGVTVGEIDSMRDPNVNSSAAKIYGDMTKDELKRSFEKFLGKLKNMSFDEWSSIMPKDPEIAGTLSGRYAYLRQYYKKHFGGTE
jgi:hypothetical protein